MICSSQIEQFGCAHTQQLRQDLGVDPRPTIQNRKKRRLEGLRAPSGKQDPAHTNPQVIRRNNAVDLIADGDHWNRLNKVSQTILVNRRSLQRHLHEHCRCAELPCVQDVLFGQYMNFEFWPLKHRGSQVHSKLLLLGTYRDLHLIPHCLCSSVKCFH